MHLLQKIRNQLLLIPPSFRKIPSNSQNIAPTISYEQKKEQGLIQEISADNSQDDAFPSTQDHDSISPEYATEILLTSDKNYSIDTEGEHQTDSYWVLSSHCPLCKENHMSLDGKWWLDSRSKNTYYLHCTNLKEPGIPYDDDIKGSFALEKDKNSLYNNLAVQVKLLEDELAKAKLTECLPLKEGSNNDVDDESSRTDEDINNSRQLKDPSWPKIYPWVYRGEGPLKKFMFCHWCKDAGKNNNITKGCKYFKKQYLDRHVNINDHRMVCAAQMQSQVNLHSSFAIQAGTDQIKVMRNMRNLYFLIQYNLSTNIFEDLCKLSKIQYREEQNQFECGNKTLNVFDNNQLTDDDNERAPYGSYQNNVSACKFIESIGRVIEQKIFQKLRDAGGWSLMIDKSNTISNEKTLAIVSKHSIAPANPIYRFLGLILLSDNTANTIVAEMNHKTSSIHIGVATQLKKKNSFILEHHCISHKLALAAKDAAKQVEEFKLYEKIVHSIYSYFLRSPERMMHLRMIEENIGDPHLTVLNIIKTHWLSLSNVIQNLHQILNSIIDALLEDSYENTLRRMNLIFQKNNVTIREVKTQLDITIYTIQSQFLGIDEAEPTWGINLRKYMNDNDIIAEKLPVIVTKFARAAIKLLEKRFPNRIQIDAFHIFDPRALPIENSNFQKYGEDEIETLGNFYGENKNISGNLFLGILNSENLTHEWPSVRFLLTNYRNSNFLEAWRCIFSDLPTFNEIYPEIAKLISILINLPLTNAVVERIFSRQNLIKTKLRNRMSIFTLNYLLLISFNGPKLEDFNFQLAYQEWCKLDRRIK
ncbi:15923_t:CDS:2 [Dentiscutata heterogama]|uniref:15923_t:CDS:1 n=1 Tax=Dentiscutata heterogama TaxID=1316150 RepID=A0ACA9L631_9GLOM|nr:15923_t:CDS:2 [Dentiscutata heterogama]